MRRQLIVTADDFGRSLPINEAVEHAHRDGILTSASLMVTEAHVADAVERAQRLPSLSVGLHLTLVDGKPALPPSEVPDLVEADGSFTMKLVRLGTRIYLDRNVRRQVAAEMRTQFDLYRATGLPLGYVDSHHHYHLHPTVFDIMLDLAVEYGAPGIRVPWEPPLVSWRARGEGLGRRLSNGLFHLNRTSRMRKAIERAGLVANDQVFGVNDSGAMDAAKVGSFLDALPYGLTEIYGHPATGRWSHRPMPDRYRIEDEYKALIDPAVMAKVREGGIALTTFAAQAASRRKAPESRRS